MEFEYILEQEDGEEMTEIVSLEALESSRFFNKNVREGRSIVSRRPLFSEADELKNRIIED